MSADEAREKDARMTKARQAIEDAVSILLEGGEDEEDIYDLVETAIAEHEG